MTSAKHLSRNVNHIHFAYIIVFCGLNGGSAKGPLI